MKKYIFNILIFLCAGIYSQAQDFYTSTTKVEYNAGSQTLQFSTKVAQDDLEKGVGKASTDASFENSVKSHLLNNVKVLINGSGKAFSFDGLNGGGDVIWIYYSIPNIADVSTISITNTLLMNTFPAQQNIINFNINGAKGTLTCKKGSESGTKNF